MAKLWESVSYRELEKVRKKVESSAAEQKRITDIHAGFLRQRGPTGQPRKSGDILTGKPVRQRELLLRSASKVSSLRDKKKRKY